MDSNNDSEPSDRGNFLFSSGFITVKGEPVIASSVVMIDLLLLLATILIFLAHH